MQRDDVGSHYPEKLVIGAGITAEIPVLAGQNAALIKYYSGGSLLIVGHSLPTGSTYAVGQEYLLGTNEVQFSNIMGSIYLMASGATVTCYLLRYRTTGV